MPVRQAAPIGQQQMPPAKARNLLLRLPRHQHDAGDDQQRAEDDQQRSLLAENVIAMVALISGLTDCSVLLRDAPIFSTPV